MYYKIINGKVVKGTTIHTPKGSITPKTKTKPKDGWKWFDDEVTATATLGVEIPVAKTLNKGDSKTSRIDSEIAHLTAQLERKQAEKVSLMAVEEVTVGKTK